MVQTILYVPHSREIGTLASDRLLFEKVARRAGGRTLTHAESSESYTSEMAPSPLGVLATTPLEQFDMKTGSIENSWAMQSSTHNNLH